jgi:predicted CoA-binding protein
MPTTLRRPASAAQPVPTARRALAVVVGAHGVAHLAGTTDVFDRASAGLAVDWLAGGWTLSDPTLLRAFGLAWAVLAGLCLLTAVAVWRGAPGWPRRLALVSLASLVLVGVALWSSVAGLAIDGALLAVALWAAKPHPSSDLPKGATHVHPREVAEEFLAQRRIAVAGVSRDPTQPANLIFRRLRDTGHEVFAVNPNARELEGGTPPTPAVSAIPGGVDGVVVVTPADASADVVADCAAAGVTRVWLHRGLGPGSTSDAAIAIAAEHGMTSSRAAARTCSARRRTRRTAGMRGLLRLTGRIPRTVEEKAVLTA